MAHTVMVFILVKQALRPIVEQVNATVMQRRQDPGPVLVERQALDTLAFRVKLSLHHFCDFFLNLFLLKYKVRNLLLYLTLYL